MKKLIMMLAMALAAALPLMAESENVGDYTWYYRINGDTAEIYKKNSLGYSTTAIWPSPTGSVSIPSTLGGKPVTSIGENAFSRCSGLTRVTIPNSVTSIGYGAFYNCTNLTSVTIGDGVTSIGDYAFSYCSGLTHITIPNSVTSIGQCAFSDCSKLTSVTMPDSVTGIGSSAFSGCSGLTSVTIPDSVMHTGHSTFSGCCGLTRVTIPDSVKIIGDYTFSGCSNLTSVAIGNSVTTIGFDAFASCSNLKSITIPSSVTLIGSRAFADCENLLLVDVLGSAVVMNEDAFYGCGNVNIKKAGKIVPTGTLAMPYYGYVNKWPAHVVVPDYVTTIGYSTFAGCTNLISVVIPDSVTSIGRYAFSGCTSLTSVTIPDSVTSIGSGAFQSCTGLTSIKIPKNAFMYDNLAYYTDTFSNCTNITSVTSSYGFSTTRYSGSSSNVTKWVIPEGTVSVGGGYEYGITEITIPDGVKYIEANAFTLCQGLKSVAIPFGVTTIGDSAFFGCTNLTSVNIPDTVVRIGLNAFGNCFALKYDETSIPGAKILDGWIVAASTNLLGYMSTPAWRKIRGCSDSVCRTRFVDDNGVSIYNGLFGLYRGTTNEFVIPNGVTHILNQAFEGCTNLTSVTIPDSVTSIGSYAFSGCNGLTSVTIPDSVTNIEHNAFSSCTSLTNVVIGKSVRSIGAYAFDRCNQLKHMELPDSVVSIGRQALSTLTSLKVGKGLRDIGESAFRCVYIDPPSCIEIIDFPDMATFLSVLENKPSESWWTGYSHEIHHVIRCSIQGEVIGEMASIVIPDGVTHIPDYAFDGCHMKYLIIPDGVTSIGSYAFSYCTVLNGVTIPSSVVSVGSGVFYESYVGQVNIPNYLEPFAGGLLSNIPWGSTRPRRYYDAPLQMPDVIDRTAKVSNVRAAQREGTKYVDIFYDLGGTGGGTWDVSLKLTQNGKAVGASSLYYNVGAGVSPGKNRYIVWDVGNDWPGNFGSLVATVNAGDSSAKSVEFDVDTRSGGFRIENVSSAYCTGQYGGIGGKKATFISDISCEVEFYVQFEQDEPDIACLMVNGIEFPEAVVRSVAEWERRFKFDMGALRPGGKLEVVAVRKDGTESAPFKANVEIASPPPMWGTWTSRVLVERSPKEGCVEYYTAGINTVWLWEETANVLELAFAGIDLNAFVEMIPLFRIWQTFDSSTGQYRICSKGGIKSDVIKKLVANKSYQSFGKFAGEELGFKIGNDDKKELSFSAYGGGGITLEWDPLTGEWPVVGADVIKVCIALDGELGFSQMQAGKGKFGIDSSVGENLAKALSLLRARAGIGFSAAREFGIKLEGDRLVAQLDLDPILNVYGYASCNSLGFNGLFNMNGKLVLNAEIPAASVSEILKRYGYSLDAQLRATLFGYELIDAQTSKTHWWIDRMTKGSTSKKLAATPSDGASFCLIPRDYGEYAKGGKVPLRSSRLETAMLKGAGNASLGDGYPNPVPSIAANGTTDHLVYLRDNSGRSAINRTEVMCRSGESNAWGAASAVWNDGTADFMPKVAVASDGTVFAAWANAKRALADSETLDAMCRNLEIAVGVRDVGTDAWTCTNLTDDAALDMNPVLKVSADGSAALVWVRNDAAEFIGSSENPSSLMLSCFKDGAWSAPQKVADVGAVLSLDLAWNGTNAEVIWAKDGDGDISTFGDREVWGVTVASGVVGTAARLSADGVDSASPHVWFDGGTVRRVWLADNVLTDGEGTVVAGADALRLPEDFELVPQPDGGAMLVWWRMGKVGLGGELLGATYDAANGTVGEAAVLGGSSTTQERAIAGVVGDDGALRLAYESVAVSTNAEGVVEFGAVELKTLRREAGIDLGISKVAFVGDVEVGELAHVCVTVVNAGGTEAKNADVWLWFGEGEDRSLVNVATTNILPLSSATVEIPWYVGSGLTDTVFTVEVDPMERLSDADRSDNTLVWRPDMGDPVLSFRDVQCINVSDTKRLIRATVHNDGMTPLEDGAIVKFWRGEAGGTLLGTDTLGIVTAGDAGEYGTALELDISTISDFAENERVVLELVAGDVHPMASTRVARELAPVVWSVVLNANGGVLEEKSRVVTNNCAVGELPIPARSGYIFIGWFTEAVDGTHVTEANVITSDVTFYAHWIDDTPQPGGNEPIWTIENGVLKAVDLNGAMEIVIPAGVTSIGNGVFWNCGGLISVTIPDGVTSIGPFAFFRCTSLTSVTIPDSVTSIGDGAFEHCENLTSLTIPNGVTSIGPFAFFRCNDALFDTTTIPGVKLVDGWAVDYTSELAGDFDLTGIRGIAGYAFQLCSELTSVMIPDGVTSIGDGAFYYCENLTSVTIGNGVISIGNEAFCECENLTSVTIGNNVTSIGDYAFFECYNLTSVTMERDCPVLGEEVFDVASSCVVRLPYGNATYDVVDGRWQEMTVEYYDPPISVAVPVVTPADGTTFTGYSCTVTITCATDGATIYYTTDGAPPRPSNRFRYTGPFTITDTAEICAFAVVGDVSSAYVTATITRTAASQPTLAEVLDVAAQAVTTGGDANWTPVNDDTAVGGHSARSGTIDPEESTWMAMSVSGAGTLSFSWKADCEKDPRNRYSYDFGVFEVDGAEKSYIDGTTAWQTVTVEITEGGTHTFRWTYSKDDYDEDDYVGEDCIWVDHVVWASSGASDVGASDVIVDMGGGKSVTVPGTWLQERTTRAATDTAANGRKVWECYVLGLDPEDNSAANDFRIVAIEMVDGVPHVEWVPKVNPWTGVEINATLKGAASLGAEIVPVTEQNKANFRFFRVEVELP